MLALIRPERSDLTSRDGPEKSKDNLLSREAFSGGGRQDVAHVLPFLAITASRNGGYKSLLPPESA